MGYANVFYVQVAGHEFPVYPEDIFSPQYFGASTCTVEIQASGEALPLILGDTFLRTIAAVFDVGGLRVGLSKRTGHHPSLLTREKLQRDRLSRSPNTKALLPAHKAGSMAYPLWVVILVGIAGGAFIGYILGT